MKSNSLKKFSIWQTLFFVILALGTLLTIVYAGTMLLKKLDIAVETTDAIADAISGSFGFVIYSFGLQVLQSIFTLLGKNLVISYLIYIAILLTFLAYTIFVIVKSIKAVKGKTEYYYNKNIVELCFQIFFVIFFAYNIYALIPALEYYPSYLIFGVLVFVILLVQLIVKIVSRRKMVKFVEQLPPLPARPPVPQNIDILSEEDIVPAENIEPEIQEEKTEKRRGRPKKK